MYPRIIDFSPLNLFGFPLAINSYGVMIALGFLAAHYGLSRELPRKGLSEELASAITSSAAIGGFLGAKLYYVIEFRQWSLASGFVWYGGLIGGTLVVLITVFRSNNPVWSVIDTIGPFLILGYGIGRIGCFLAGDGCYGKPGDFPWCVTFPEAVVTHFSYKDVIHYVTPNSVTDVLTPVHPTPIYETIISCFSFGLLWRFRRKLEYRSGVLFGLTLLAMGIERFTVEFWRINQKYVWLFSGAQVISLILISIGILLVIYRWPKAQLQA